MSEESFFTPLSQGAVTLHEMYLAYIEAGFAQEQALYLLGKVLEGISIGSMLQGNPGN